MNVSIDADTCNLNAICANYMHADDTGQEVAILEFAIALTLAKTPSVDLGKMKGGLPVLMLVERWRLQGD